MDLNHVLLKHEWVAREEALNTTQVWKVKMGQMKSKDKELKPRGKSH